MGRPKELTDDEREALLAKGYRPVEIWVPDLDSPAMRDELRQQAQAVSHADEQDSVFEWLEVVHVANDAADRH